MDDKIITSIYNSSLQKRPKKLQNNVFKLYIYISKRIKLQPGHFINVDKKLFICLNELLLYAYFYQLFVKMDFA